MNPAEVNDRGLAPDGGKIAIAAIAEWLGPLCVAQPGFNQFTDIAPLLLGDWCDAREWFAVGVEGQRSVADREYLRMTRYGEIGLDYNPTDTIAFWLRSNVRPAKRPRRRPKLLCAPRCAPDPIVTPDEFDRSDRRAKTDLNPKLL